MGLPLPVLRGLQSWLLQEATLSTLALGGQLRKQAQLFASQLSSLSLQIALERKGKPKYYCVQSIIAVSLGDELGWRFAGPAPASLINL